MIEPYATEFHRYRRIAEKALEQVSDEALNRVPGPDGNSLAMLVRHLSGNLLSRFTDFLTSDGEKPWRRRDEEFEERAYTRAEVEEMWRRGWEVLDGALDSVSESDLSRKVTIRGQELRVDAALARSLAHLAYHVGQMVLMARREQGSDWIWISIPKGGSEQYNRKPTKERGPG
jgi:uncharacterized damage-inducible protein DinB